MDCGAGHGGIDKEGIKVQRAVLLRRELPFLPRKSVHLFWNAPISSSYGNEGHPA